MAGEESHRDTALTVSTSSEHLEPLSDDIKQLIQARIDPHRHGMRKPPFRVAELIVMALVMLGHPSTRTEIVAWMCFNFNYYSKMAARAVFVQSRAGWFRRTLDTKEVERFLKSTSCEGEASAFFEHGIPIHSEGFGARERGHETIWQTRPGLARQFLHLSESTPVANGFPFMRLPAELRNAIYEMLFTLHPNEEITPRYRPSPRVMISSSSHSNKTTAPLSTFLAFSYVNKAIHHETKNMFYSTNTWRFEGLLELQKFVSRLPRRCRFIRRMQIIHSLGFVPDHRTKTAMDATVRKMSKGLETILKHGSLQDLTLVIDEAEWKVWSIPLRRLPFDGYSGHQLPGIHAITQALSLRELKVIGDCDEVRQALQPLMKRIEDIKSGTLGADGKRKADGEIGARKAKKTRSTKNLRANRNGHG